MNKELIKILETKRSKLENMTEFEKDRYMERFVSTNVIPIYKDNMEVVGHYIIGDIYKNRRD